MRRYRKNLRILLRQPMAKTGLFVFLFFQTLGTQLIKPISLYSKISWYDSFVHFIAGIVIVNLVVIWCKERGGLNYAAPLLALAVVLSVGLLWETYELFIDAFVGPVLGMQKLSPSLVDASTDLTFVFLGGITSLSLFGFYHRLRRDPAESGGKTYNIK